MKKYRSAIKTLRANINSLSKEKVRLRAEIRKLSFDDAGNPRPDTGPDRNTMRIHYRWQVGRHIRASLIAYGLLRGKPYKTIEPKIGEPIESIHLVMCKIHEAFGEEVWLRSEWPMARVVSLIMDGVDIEVPEAVPPEPPKPAPKGILAQLRALW